MGRETQGGNSSSSKRPYQNMKSGGQKALDVRALSGGETFGDQENTQLFDGNGNPVKHDLDMGISRYGETPDGGGYKGVANGYLTESKEVMGGVKSRQTHAAKNANPQPGGGWE